MPLRIIKTGLSLTGFEKYIKEIKSYVLPDGSRKLILMVPDRFSYNAEKLICDELGGIGFNGVNVLTLSKFIRKSCKESDKVLLTEGKQMLIRRILNKTIDEASVFNGAKDKNGFIESVLEVIEDWKRFCVNPIELEAEIEAMPENVTKQKLRIIKDVFVTYGEEFASKGYKDEADMLLDAAVNIRSESGYADAVVWIDGFVEFVPAELEVVYAFLEVGADVRIYLPCKLGGNVDEGDIYSVPEKTFSKLIETCKERGFRYSVSEEFVDAEINEDIAFLCDTYDEREKSYGAIASSFILRESDDIYEEVEGVASEIIKLVGRDGFSFSDISLLCGDLNEYSSCIEAVFERYSIPYFSDYKFPLINHPVSVLFTSVFDLLKNRSLPIPCMVRYLKSGYVLNDSDSIDILSMFIQKRGIKGGMWKEDKYFETSPCGFFDEALGKKTRKNVYSSWLTALRKSVSEPLYNFYEKTRGKLPLSVHISAFFEYLSEIKLFEKIQNNIEHFERIGEENEAARLAHVWNLIVNLFNQMFTMAGDEKVSRANFGEYLKAGLEASEISIIPTVQNGVSVSDAGHRKGSGVKALFVIGATRDTVPAVKREDGLITESELEGISSLPVSVGKSHRNLSKEFELITAFSETSKLLYISWCSMGATGEKKIKSALFDTLMLKFPGLDFTKCLSDNAVDSPESMLHKLLVRISNSKELTLYDLAAKEWFSTHEQWKNALSLLTEAEKYKELTGSISKDIAEQLYKNITAYSVSRIENYFKCPFKYFLSFGLGLDDNEAYGMKSTDTGNVVHHALAQFCTLVEKGAETKDEKRRRWLEIIPSVRDEYIKTVMTEIMNSSGIDIGEDYKLQSVFARMTETVSRAAEIIILMIKKGKFDIYANEHRFDDFTLSGAAGDVVFNGIIDRIDFYEVDGTTKIRIVDYKTGEKTFNLKDVLNGVDLQLVVYAMAAEKLFGSGTEVAGFFYNSIKKRIALCDDPSKIVTEVSKLYKLIGTVVEEMNDKELETQNCRDMDSDLSVFGISQFLPVKLTKKGLYDKRASAVNSKETMNKLFKVVRETVSEGVAALESGDVRVYPYVSGKTDACAFCPYGSVCMYDRCRSVETNTGEKGKAILDTIIDK